MIDKIRAMLDKLYSEKNLILRFREPAACVFCTPRDSIEKYHAAFAKSKRFVVEDPKQIKNLTLLEDRDLISGKCPKCGAERIKEKFQLEKIYWVTCHQCHNKSLSFMENICPICSEISKEAKAKFIKEHGG